MAAADDYALRSGVVILRRCTTRLATLGATVHGGVLRHQVVSAVVFRLTRSPRLAMIVSAGWATGLPGYGGLTAVLAEAHVFQLVACLNGARPTAFLTFAWGKADSLWLLGCFRLCGSGRGFRCISGRIARCFGFASFLALGFGLLLRLIERVDGHRKNEFPFEGSAYRPLVRGLRHLDHACYVYQRYIPAGAGSADG